MAGALAISSTGCGGAEPPKDPTKAPDAKEGGEKDTDGDGVPDGTDKCPDKKEDGQLPEPKDGCPKAN